MRETEREATPVRTVETPSLDQVFDVLANRQRRFALYYLRECSEGVASIEEVADHVVALEDDPRPVEDHREAILTALQHVHLPKLQDAGILEFDSRSEMIRYWSQPSLDEWLEHAYHKESR